MIRIRKSAGTPRVLRKEGTRASRALMAAYSREPRSYDSGMKSFKFAPALYGHVSVKEALRKAQHGKCAYCEAKILHIADGDVDHFRPKARCRQAAGAPLLHPGYYWLAYEWGNLLLACTRCNQRCKRDIFPLKLPARRARNHQHDVSIEEPLLLNPAEEDPGLFIGFRQEVAYAVRGNRRGKSTIEVLQLNRPDLAERRRDWLEKVRMLRVAAENGAPGAREVLQRMQWDGQEYALMTRTALR